MSLLPIGQEAGQRESLVSRLRGLIRDYPAGLGVVKEFLQNADDANATWLRFTLDLRSHPGDRIPDPRMTPLLKPALLVESDQVFTEDDLENIQTIGAEGKLGEANKTGRFGLGFNTAYNLTDYPCFATRDRIVCFDPLRECVAQGDRPGRLWTLGELWEHAPDWPRAFGLAHGTTELNRTIFRLPLRTAGQATQERISALSFPPEQVETIFDEVAESGGALLLFLRSILHLGARVVYADGTEQIRISIRTTNAAEVEPCRARVAAACAGNVGELIERWATDSHLLLLSQDVYEHRFAVTGRQTARTERWIVCNGLFLDPDQKLLTTARRMVGIGEKALPLAGAAARLDGQSDGVAHAHPLKGHVYCGLPLPDPSLLPFHLNGYFDLDSSRSQLTHGSDLIGDAAVRVEWNAALIEHAVTAAVAKLLTSVRDQVPVTGISSYYDLWPNLERLASGPLTQLGAHVYGRMATQDGLHVRSASQAFWTNAQQVRLPPPSWSENLRRALLEDGLSLPDPPLPDHIGQGFQHVDHGLSSWTPHEIGGWLHMDDDLACNLTDAPRACLRQRAFVTELLRFCASRSLADVKNLPLALLADGTLRVFGHQLLFIGNADVRSIFRERPHWFIDAGLQSSLSLKVEPSAKLLEMNVAAALLNLKTHLAPEENGSRRWRPAGKDIPNEPWLLEVLTWLSRQKDAPRVEDLRKLTLIPNQSRRLVCPGDTQTPLLPEEGTPVELRKAVMAFGIPVVTGSPSLLLALRMLANSRSDELLWPLTARDVLDTLGEMADVEGRVPSNSTHRHTLLTWLSASDRGTPFDQDALRRLADLPLWPTQDGRVIAASTADVFLPTNYTPPDFIGRLTLLQPGPANAWRTLLHRLGVRDLDLPAYVETVLVPGYPTLEAASQVLALRWLRDETLTGGLNRLTDEEARRIRTLLRETRFIRSMDGEYRSAASLCSPDAKETLELLGPIAIVPDMTAYADDRAKWLAHFTNLGMRTKPTPPELVKRVEQLVQQAEEDAHVVEEPLLAVLEHLQHEWESLPPSTHEFLTAHLRRAWLPALRDSARAVRVAGFRVPEARLFRPSELYPQTLEHLVGSQAPLFARRGNVSRVLSTALGMPMEPPLDVVAAHVEVVRRLWDSPHHGGLSPGLVARMARDLYAFLARHARGSAASDSRDEQSAAAGSEHDETVKESVGKIARHPCIWDSHRQCFWLAQHTFARPVPFFGDLRAHVQARNDLEAAGLNLLGRRGEPEVEDFVAFLQDLSDRYSRAPLPEDAARQALHALSRIEPGTHSSFIRPDLPMLCGDGSLRPARAVLVDDAPWWRDRLAANASLDWLHPRVDARLALAATANRASVAVSEVLLEHIEVSDGARRRWCEKCQQTISSPEFLAGLLRLFVHQQRDHTIELEPETFQERLRLRVQACGRLLTGLVCPQSGQDEPFGEAEVPCFLNEEGRRATLLVAADDPEEAIPALAVAINRRLGDDGLEDLAPLEAILRCDPRQIEIRLDQRRIPRVDVTFESQELDWPAEEASHGGSPAAADTTGTDDSWPPPHAEHVDALEDADDRDRIDNDLTNVLSLTAAEEATDRIIESTNSGSSDTTDCPQPNSESTSAAGRWPLGRRRTSSFDEPIVPGPEPWSGEGEHAPVSEGPPLEPGDGSSGVRGTRTRGRLRSYLFSDTAATADGREIASEVERAAVDRVVADERAQGHVVREMPRLNEGYDLEVVIEGEPEPRLLEVKGLRGEWDVRGVSLTATEFRTAQKFGARYWIVVVEYALDSANARITRIRNLADAVTEFRLDSGWRALHESPRLTHPSAGMLLSNEEGLVGTIDEVRPFGAMYLLVLRTETGERKTLAFNPGRHRLSTGEDDDGAAHSGCD